MTDYNRNFLSNLGYFPSQSKRRKPSERQTERKWLHCCCSDRITACSRGFIWQNLSSRFIVPMKSQLSEAYWNKSHSEKLRKHGLSGASEVASIALTSHPFWLLSGQKLKKTTKNMPIFRHFSTFYLENRWLSFNNYYVFTVARPILQ